jgi:hypothetical protein
MQKDQLVAVAYVKRFCTMLLFAKNGVKIWRIRVACWISEAARTHTDKYVIFTAFPLLQ